MYREILREYIAQSVNEERKPGASDPSSRIEEPEIKRDAQGQIKSVRLVFGPHHFVDVFLENGRVQCAIGATHHGIRADAADVPSNFERMIDELTRSHPDNAF